MARSQPADPALLAVALGLFAIGYTRLARDVPHAATFAALLTHGLGRTVGGAAAFVAVLSYNCVQIGLYGLLGGILAGQLGGAWWGWALVAWAVVAVIGYRGVTLGASVVAVVLVLELGMIVLFDVTALTHPAQTDVGAWLQPWRPDLLAVDGVGGVLAFGVAAFLGFETTAAFGEEVRSERSVGRATWTCLAFLGPSLADPSGIAPVLLPLLVVAAALAGAQRARWLRGNDPAAWQRLGRGRPAPLALRDVVVADLEL